MHARSRAPTSRLLIFLTFAYAEPIVLKKLRTFLYEKAQDFMCRAADLNTLTKSKKPPKQQQEG